MVEVQVTQQTIARAVKRVPLLAHASDVMTDDDVLPFGTPLRFGCALVLLVLLCVGDGVLQVRRG